MHRMRIISLLTVAALPLLAVPAAAQMYPGQDVIVNPAAIPRTQLLQPGQPYPGIMLHPPRHHRRHRAVAKADVPAEATSPDSVSVAADSTPPPAKPRHVRHAAAAPAASTTAAPDQGASNALPFSFGEDTPPAAPPTRVAKAEPPPAQTGKPAKGDIQSQGYARRGQILFVHNSTDLQREQLHGISLLASDLNSAIEAGATSIQLMAYGGAPGDKSSDARRIALKRATAIRQVLIDNGVPAGRIDVRAMGGITDNGQPDRVDVYVRAS